MTGRELLKKLRALAKARGWELAWQANLGKGSHGRLTLNGHKTTLPALRHELKRGTLKAILQQLDITEKDLNP